MKSKHAKQHDLATHTKNEAWKNKTKTKKQRKANKDRQRDGNTSRLNTSAHSVASSPAHCNQNMIDEPAGASEHRHVVPINLAAPNNYDVIQVGRDATTDEIKKTYKRLALKIHPDKHAFPNAVEAFKKALAEHESLTGGVQIRPYEPAPEQAAPASRDYSSGTETKSESYSSTPESEEEEVDIDGAPSSGSCSAAQPATRAKRSTPESETDQVPSSRTEAMTADEMRLYIRIIRAQVNAARMSRSGSAERGVFATTVPRPSPSPQPQPQQQPKPRPQPPLHPTKQQQAPPPPGPPRTHTQAPKEMHWQHAQDHHRVSTVHVPTKAKHAEGMTLLQLLLDDVYDISRSVAEPKAKRAPWSSQWSNMTRISEGIARTVAEHNCSYGLNDSLHCVVQHVSVEKYQRQALCSSGKRQKLVNVKPNY